MPTPGIVVSPTTATGNTTEPFSAYCYAENPIYTFQVIGVSGWPTVNIVTRLEDPAAAAATFVTLSTFSALAPGSIVVFNGHLSQIKFTIGGTGSAKVICRLPSGTR